MSPPIIQQQPKIIGVTGTNGKTSITHFIARALKLHGLNTGVIGTLGNGLIDHLEPARLTTPSPDELKKIFADFLDKKTDVIALEASSHGLDQNRLKNTEFFAGIFTNLTRDHLDYHKTLKNYEQAKFKLFADFKPNYNIINVDDKTGLKFAKQLKSTPLYCTSTELKKCPIKNIPFIYASKITPHSLGTTAEIHTPWGDGILETSLFGKFNISNLLAVVTVLGLLNIKLSDTLNYIAQLKNISGRMQVIHAPNKSMIVIDYAHTPDALEKTLKTLREHCHGNIWCVFGCGGDRDKGKRPLMGRIAEKLADFVILTDDNPRTENPLEIIAEIKTGIKNKETIITEHDRQRAIQHAIQSAQPNDIVLIAGKGHETYQEINHERFPFSDELEVKKEILCYFG
ncbi:MAG TPA: UDP-N-acetylmuramoyl-L-alanyl-D-glutamate--2,6-diaminopimelate ligase [Gammaproteobacteria bacterium]|nr:UDP-N-acetylmuramoyl-L-alanyl-D-glutamate--2,6-diaminopimelate ligase [Gammaproteobacteria bacterium]